MGMTKPDESRLPAKSDLGTDTTLIGDEHIRRYQATDGEVGYIWNGVTTLLLTTKGRKTGLQRTIPIIFTKVGDAYVIIGSQAGAPDHPLWYLNIQADPHVRVQVKGDKFDAVARAAESPERERLWAEAVKQWPNFDIYQTRTTRQIPVVVIERVNA
jgi:deazaflavin-dependent oxidoreductase (nitroreductase family)